MVGNPTLTAMTVGIVLRNPKAAPDARAMVLFGPGVPAPATKNRMAEKIGTLRTYSLPPRRRNSPSVAPTEAHPVHRTLSVGCHHGVMRITHLGHACVLVEAAGTRVLKIGRAHV